MTDTRPLYNAETADVLSDISALQQKAFAVIDAMIECYLEFVYTEDGIRRGIPAEAIVRDYPKVQTLADVVRGFLFEMGAEIEALHEDGQLIQPPGDLTILGQPIPDASPEEIFAAISDLNALNSERREDDE